MCVWYNGRCIGKLAIIVSYIYEKYNYTEAEAMEGFPVNIAGVNLDTYSNLFSKNKGVNC